MKMDMQSVQTMIAGLDAGGCAGLTWSGGGTVLEAVRTKTGETW